MMLRKYILAFLLPLFSLLAAQNTAIRDAATGSLLPDTQFFCPNQVFSLSASAAGVSSGGYNVSIAGKSLSRGSGNINFPVTAGNNNFSAVSSFPAGFSFSLYGVSYTKYVVSSNGRLILGKGNELDALPGTKDTLPSTQIPSSIYQDFNGKILPLAQIFFGFSPRNYSQNTDYSRTILKNEALTFNGNPVLIISIIGTNPLGTYNRVSNAVVYLVSGTNEILMQYYEATSDTQIISGLIQNTAVMGIQNAAATKAKWPSEGTNPDADDPNAQFRYGRWNNTQDVYKFTPATKAVSKIEWFDNGTSIGTGATINFKPQDDDLLKVVFTFDDGTADDTNSVRFKNFAKPAVSQAPGATCGAGTTLTVTNSQNGVGYNWISDDPAFNAAGTSIVVAKSGTYYAVPNGCLAQKSDPVVVTIASPITPPTFADGASFPYCDNLGQPSVPINLLKLVNYTPDAGSIVVFTDVAGNIIGNAANNYTVSVNSGSPLNVVMGITSSVVNCPIRKPFVVSYQSFPPSQIALLSDKLCYGTTDYGIAKFRADFPQYSAYDVAFSTDNVNFNLNSVNPSVTNPAYVRLTKSGFSCTSTITLSFDFYDEILIKPITPFPDHCTSLTEFFDLNITKAELEYAPNITATFYSDAARTKQITDLHYRGGGTIYTKISNGRCAIDGPQFQLNVYPPPTLIKDGPEIKYSECGSDKFDLSTNILDYAPNWTRYYEIRYYDQNGNKLSEPQWQNYNPDVSGNPYMVFVFNETNNLECSNRIGFTLVKKIKPTLSQSQIPVCGQTVYSLDGFKNFITNNNASAFDFSDENGNPLPPQFDVANLPTVRVIIKDKNTHCTSDVQTVQFVNGSPTPLLNDNFKLPAACDTDPDGLGVSFDLTAAQPSISTDAAAVYTYFDSVGNPIRNPKDYKNQTAFAETVHGKVSSGILCPTDFTVELTINTPTAVQANVNTNLCFGEAMTVEIENFAEFQKVELITPAGNIPVNKSLTINYQDVKIGSKYILKGTNLKGCISSSEFTPSDQNQPKISQINQSDSQIEVVTNGGAQPYSYYFNGVKNPSGNILQNPTEDEYEIYAVSAEGCRGPSVFVYNIKIPNAITPNGDGINDVWTVENLDKMADVQVSIADRFGNVDFRTSDAHKTAWDGTASGRPLPTASYWYVVKWHDPAQNKDVVRQGWILLKNRN